MLLVAEGLGKYISKLSIINGHVAHLEAQTFLKVVIKLQMIKLKYETHSEKERDRKRETDRQRDRQTDRETDRPRKKAKNRVGNREKYIWQSF